MDAIHTIEKLTPFQRLLCAVPGANLRQGASWLTAIWKTADSAIAIHFFNARHQELFIQTTGVHDFFPITDNSMSDLEHMEAWRKEFVAHRELLTDFHAIVILTAILAIEPPTPPPYENDR